MDEAAVRRRRRGRKAALAAALAALPPLLVALSHQATAPAAGPEAAAQLARVFAAAADARAKDAQAHLVWLRSVPEVAGTGRGALLRALVSFRSAHPEFAYVAVADAAGKLRGAAPDDWDEARILAEAARTAPRSNAPSVGPVRNASGQNLSQVIAPLVRVSGVPVITAGRASVKTTYEGFLLGGLSWNDPSFSPAAAGGGASLFLVTRDGAVVFTHPEEAPTAPLSALAPELRKGVAASRILPARAGGFAAGCAPAAEASLLAVALLPAAPSGGPTNWLIAVFLSVVAAAVAYRLAPRGVRTAPEPLPDSDDLMAAYVVSVDAGEPTERTSAPADEDETASLRERLRAAEAERRRLASEAESADRRADAAEKARDELSRKAGAAEKGLPKAREEAEAARRERDAALGSGKALDAERTILSQELQRRAAESAQRQADVVRLTSQLEAAARARDGEAAARASVEEALASAQAVAVTHAESLRRAESERDDFKTRFVENAEALDRAAAEITSLRKRVERDREGQKRAREERDGVAARLAEAEAARAEAKPRSERAARDLAGLTSALREAETRALSAGRAADRLTAERDDAAARAAAAERETARTGEEARQTLELAGRSERERKALMAALKESETAVLVARKAVTEAERARDLARKQAQAASDAATRGDEEAKRAAKRAEQAMRTAEASERERDEAVGQAEKARRAAEEEFSAREVLAREHATAGRHAVAVEKDAEALRARAEAATRERDTLRAERDRLQASVSAAESAAREAEGRAALAEDGRSASEEAVRTLAAEREAEKTEIAELERLREQARYVQRTLMEKALETKRLSDEIEEWKALSRIEPLSAPADAVRTLCEGLRWSRAVLFRFDPMRREAKEPVSYPPFDGSPVGALSIPLVAGRSVVADAALTRRPVLLESRGERSPTDRVLSEQLAVAGFCAAPVGVGDELFGILVAGWREYEPPDLPEFAARVGRVAERLAERLSPARAASRSSA